TSGATLEFVLRNLTFSSSLAHILSEVNPHADLVLPAHTLLVASTALEKLPLLREHYARPGVPEHVQRLLAALDGRQSDDGPRAWILEHAPPFLAHFAATLSANPAAQQELPRLAERVRAAVEAARTDDAAAAADLRAPLERISQLLSGG